MHIAAAGEGRKEPLLTVLERTAEPLVKADRPWEDFTLSSCNVLRIENQWHLWYNAYDHGYRTDADCYFCYARSKDGIHWAKPSLGVFSYKGSKDNNILEFGCAGNAVFLDERRRRRSGSKRWALAAAWPTWDWWIYGATSPDGIHWKWREKPFYKKNSADSDNVCIHDGDIYRLYVRMWAGGHCSRVSGLSATPSRPGSAAFAIRSRSLNSPRATTSTYSLQPSGGEAVQRPVSRCSRRPAETGWCSCLCTLSRDGKQFRQLGHVPILPLGKSFDSKCIYVGPGATPAAEPDTYWFYYLGMSVPHDANKPTEVRSSGGYGRFLLSVAR